MRWRRPFFRFTTSAGFDRIDFSHCPVELSHDQRFRDLADGAACLHLISKENGVGHIVLKTGKFLLQPSRDPPDGRLRENASCAEPDEGNEKEDGAQRVNEREIRKPIFEPDDEETSQQDQNGSRGEQDQEFNEGEELMTEG